MTSKRERSGNGSDESGGEDDYLVGETSGPREGKRKVNRACESPRSFPPSLPAVPFVSSIWMQLPVQLGPACSLSLA